MDDLAIRTSEQRPGQRPHLSYPPKQWLALATPIERTEVRVAPSLVVPTTAVADWAHADQSNRGQSCVLNCRDSQLSAWLSPRRPREQKPGQRPQHSCPPIQWLAEPTSTDLTEARIAPSPFVPAATLAGWAHDDQANRGQRRALRCRVRQHSGWLSPRRPSEQRPAPRPDLSGPQTQCLRYADRGNRGQFSAVSCCVRNECGSLSPCRPREQWLEQCPHLSCPPPQWLAEPTLTKQTGKISAINVRAKHHSDLAGTKRTEAR